MTISALPPITYPVNKSIFEAQMDAFIPALSTFGNEANALAAAMNLNATTDSSASSVLIGTGSKSFTVSAGKSYSKGMWLTIAATASPTVNSLIGQVESYAGTALVVTVPSNGVFGSGTYAAWTIALTAVPSTVDNGFKPLTATIPTNTLVINMGPCSTLFRPTTLNTGTPVQVSNAVALTLTAPVGASFGAVNAVAARLIVLELNNAGTKELAVINQAGGNDLAEMGLISTTAISAASTANNVAYSTTARTSLAYRVVGCIDWTQATAGTYATALTLVQPAGGQALAAMASLGYGQTRVAKTIALNTTYYNPSSKPIIVSFTYYFGAAGFANIYAYAAGVTLINGVAINSAGATYGFPYSMLVPPYSSYMVNATGTASTTIIDGFELR